MDSFIVKFLKYVAIPLILLIISCYIIKNKSGFIEKLKVNVSESDINEKLVKRLIWLISISYILILGLMSVLQYLTLHSAVYDLGLFDWLTWSLIHGRIQVLFMGHYAPIMLAFSATYEFFAHPLVLLFLQIIIVTSSVIPLFKLCRIYIKDIKLNFIVILVFLLYSGTEYLSMIEFRTDHLFIPLALWAYYFLQKDNVLGLVCSIIGMSLIKEPLLLSVAFFGILITCEKLNLSKLKRSLPYILGGILVFILELGLFVYVTKTLIPMFSGEAKHFAIGGSAYGYLGRSLDEVVRNLLLKPWIWVKELFIPSKISYIIAIFFPLLWLPLLKPKTLLPALPALGISLLSRFPNYYGIQFHYTASVTPFVFIALVQVLGEWEQRQISDFKNAEINRVRLFEAINEIKSKILSNCSLPALILIMSIYFNIVNSPSPISISFWKENYDRKFNWHNYIYNPQDKVLFEAFKVIPSDAEACIQLNVNWPSLMHRFKVHVFPSFAEQSDYVLLDTNRPLYVIDEINPQKYYAEMDKLKKTHDIIFSKDGVMVFRKKGLTK